MCKISNIKMQSFATICVAIVLLTVQWHSMFRFTNKQHSISVHDTSLEHNKFIPIIWQDDGTPKSIDEVYPDSETFVSKEFEWLQEYVRWHHAFRELFPDTQLLEHPDAPKVTVVYDCNLGFHGLNDRVSYFGASLFTSFQSDRVMLIKWYSPDNLETFLSPNLLNWTIPNSINITWDNRCTRESSDTIDITDKIELRPWNLLDYDLKKREQLWNAKEIYKYFWHALFRPSPLLQEKLDEAMETTGIRPGHYNAVHCRVKHPAHRGESGVWSVDRKDFNYTGIEREVAIRTAKKAIECSGSIALQSKRGNATEKELTFFFSDAEQLTSAAIRSEPPQDEIEAALQNASFTYNVVGLKRDKPLLHIGTRTSGEVHIDSYLSTFVDLYIASSARCMALGVGNFGFLAAKISGTKCLVTHTTIKKKETIIKWNIGWYGAVPKCQV